METRGAIAPSMDHGSPRREKRETVARAIRVVPNFGRNSGAACASMGASGSLGPAFVEQQRRAASFVPVWLIPRFSFSCHKTMLTPRRRRAVYISCTALIATVSLFAFAQNTTTAPPQRARLVLLSAPRSGSTLLVEMLRTHGDVVMHGEPFHEQDLRASRKDGLARNVTVDDAAFRRRRERPQELLEALGKQHANRRVVGFKLFSKHLDWKRLDTFLDWATHLILLRRDDAFAQYVSICLAQASNVWAAYPGSAKHDHVVSVDAALFDTWSKHEAAFVETVERALAKAANPPGVLHLTYERDLCAPHARRNTMRRVERFLASLPTERAQTQSICR